jgi:hypothetical protein
VSDEIDAANDRMLQDTERAIRAAARVGMALPAIGVCHNCGEPLEMTVRFCDKDCMTDWEARSCRE